MFLNGSELAGFIKERQSKHASRLKSSGTLPKLCIIQAKDDPAINTYVRLKKNYGDSIGVVVEIKNTSAEKIDKDIESSNNEPSIHGVIVQLPIPQELETSKILNLVNKQKDVDGLCENSPFDSATATAILWLLAGYNIELNGKKIVIVGQGKLVGAPLSTMLETAGHDVVRCDENTVDLEEQVKEADILVSGTGVPRLIKSDWLKPGAVAVDAGTAGEGGVLVGDFEERILERSDLKLTPKKGGVGPLTVCALFENVLRAAS